MSVGVNPSAGCGVALWGRLARTWTPPRPAKTTGGVRTDLQSVPAMPPGWPSWRHSYAWLRCWRQASPPRLDRDRFRVPSAGTQPDQRRLTWADSDQNRGRLPLIGSEQLGSNRGRIRAVSSDCLRSPLQPDLAGHNRYAPRSRRSERCVRNTRRTARLVCRQGPLAREPPGQRPFSRIRSLAEPRSVPVQTGPHGDERSHQGSHPRGRGPATALDPRRRTPWCRRP